MVLAPKHHPLLQLIFLPPFWPKVRRASYVFPQPGLHDFTSHSLERMFAPTNSGSHQVLIARNDTRWATIFTEQRQFAMFVRDALMLAI